MIFQENHFVKYLPAHTELTSTSQHTRDGILSTMTHSYYLTLLGIVKHKSGYPQSRIMSVTVSSFFTLILFTDKHRWATNSTGMFGHVPGMTVLHATSDLSCSLYINPVWEHKPLTITQASVIRYEIGTRWGDSRAPGQCHSEKKTQLVIREATKTWQLREMLSKHCIKQRGVWYCWCNPSPALTVRCTLVTWRMYLWGMCFSIWWVVTVWPCTQGPASVWSRAQYKL